MAKKEEEGVVWRDRKRHFGLPLSFTVYKLKEDRLFLQQGFFTTRYEETLLYRIRDLSLRKTLWQKIVGVGSIVVTSSDKSNPYLELRNIKNTMEVKEIIHGRVEEMKNKKRMRVNEMIDSPFDGDAEGDIDFDDEL